MPSTLDTSSSSCYGKSRTRSLSDSKEENKLFKTKVSILNCRPEDVKLKIEGNRVIIEGTLLKKNKNKEKPTYFSKHYIMPENCNLDEMRYTITPEGVYITAPRKDTVKSSVWPKLEENCTTNCVDLNDKFEIRLDVSEFRPEDIKIKVNGNTITIKAKRLQETGMKRIIKTYTLPDNCEITKLERKFTTQGHLLLTVPKFLGLFISEGKRNSYSNGNTQDNVKCKFNITSEKFEIKIDVSSYSQQDINIIQHKRMVTVEGKRCEKLGEIEGFEKAFVLPPDYDVTKIDRKFHTDGVLVITIPRFEGKQMEDFKTFLPENAICDMQIKDGYVEIKLDIVGYTPEDIIIKISGKHTVTIEGKQICGKGKINKSFMKSYMLPPDCDAKRIKKHMTSNGILIVRVPRSKRTSSLDDLSMGSDQTFFANRTKNGSVDNLSESEDQAMVDSAELDKEKFEMKFNVQGFQTEDIYVKIHDTIVIVECRHASPGKGLIKSYLVPKEFDLKALRTYITHDDILIVTIPRLKFEKQDIFLNSPKKELSRAYNNESNEYTSEKIGDNYVIKVDIRGYNNNDISLDVEGQNIIVQGGHLGNMPISKSFSKKFKIPFGYNVDSLIYYVSVGGFLIIEIPNGKANFQNESKPKLFTCPDDSRNSSEYSSMDDQDLYTSTNKMKAQLPRINEESTPEQFLSYKKEVVENPNKPSRQINYRKLKNEKFSPVPSNKSKKDLNTGSIVHDREGNELFHMGIDIRDYEEKEIDVRIKGQNLRVEGKQNTHNKGSFIPQNFVVPDDFNMRGVKTNLEDGILSINVPKFITKIPPEKCVPRKTKEKDILSNVKIGKENIIVEIDSSDLLIEDFEITTNKNVLTIEVLKGKSQGADKFKTKVDLPDDSLIDEISKKVTVEGKLFVTVPRKVIKETISDPPIEEVNSEEEQSFNQAEIRKSCLVLSKTNLGGKSKSVKFLVDDFENETDETVKFATLPRTTKAKSYNSVFLPESPVGHAANNLDTNENFELKVYVPHHEPDEVIVKLRGSTITIEGNKKNDKGNTYFSKNFFKSYTVPKNIDASQLKTSIFNDYLIITAPKKG